jgi:hypothetical protein
MIGNPCPKCGAYGNQQCSTVSGRDHKARIDAEAAAADYTYNEYPS